MKFLHLTDTHLVAGGELLYGLDPAERLRACVADINTHHGDADMAVITGDLAHFGDAAAYDTLRNILAELTMPVHLLLGNHDRRDSFTGVFGGRTPETAAGRQRYFDTSAGRFLFLDTTIPGSHAGYYDRERLDWLTEKLSECGEREAFLFMHHPPFAVGIPAMDVIGLQQAELFKTAVKPLSAKIRHIFFGHVHRHIAGSWCAVPYTTLRGTNHQVWLDFSENSTVPGSHEPPTYCIVMIDAERVVVHYHDFLYDGPLFGLSDVSYNFWEEQQRRNIGDR